MVLLYVYIAVQGKLLPFIKRLKPPFHVPDSVVDIILIKFGMNKGGGSVKHICSPVNVEHPQSVRNVQPICKFTANGTRENMSAAFFNKNSPGKRTLKILSIIGVSYGIAF